MFFFFLNCMDQACSCMPACLQVSISYGIFQSNVIVSEKGGPYFRKLGSVPYTYPLQALTQSDTFLSKLGVVKEIVDDEAVSAQVYWRSLYHLMAFFIYDYLWLVSVLLSTLLFQLVGSNKLEDVGIIASSRVAKMYGLDLLTENIQVRSSILCNSSSPVWFS